MIKLWPFRAWSNSALFCWIDKSLFGLRWMGENAPKAVQCISYRPMVYLFESADPKPSTWTQPTGWWYRGFWIHRGSTRDGPYQSLETIWTVTSNDSKLSHSSSVRLAKYRSQERCCVLCHISNRGLHILRKAKKAELTYCTIRLFTADMNGDAHKMS